VEQQYRLSRHKSLRKITQRENVILLDYFSLCDCKKRDDENSDEFRTALNETLQQEKEKDKDKDSYFTKRRLKMRANTMEGDIL